MARLGYDRYGAVGNDAGSMISPELGRIDPDHVAGVHVTQLFSFPSGDPAEMKDLAPDEQSQLQTLQWFYENKFSFNTSWRSSRRPSGYAIDDSPVGLLAWHAQLLGEELDPDFVLTNVMTYWLTRTGSSAARLYYENAHAPAVDRADDDADSDSPGSAVTSTASAGSRNGTTRTSFTGRRTITAATSRRTRFPTCTFADVRAVLSRDRPVSVPNGHVTAHR